MGIIFTFQVSPGAAKNQTYSGLRFSLQSRLAQNRTAGQDIRACVTCKQVKSMRNSVGWKVRGGRWRDRIMAKNRGLRPRSADKSRGEIIRPQNATKAEEEDIKNSQRGVKKLNHEDTGAGIEEKSRLLFVRKRRISHFPDSKKQHSQQDRIPDGVTVEKFRENAASFFFLFLGRPLNREIRLRKPHGWRITVPATNQLPAAMAENSEKKPRTRSRREEDGGKEGEETSYYLPRGIRVGGGGSTGVEQRAAAARSRNLQRKRWMRCKKSAAEISKGFSACCACPPKIPRSSSTHAAMAAWSERVQTERLRKGSAICSGGGGGQAGSLFVLSGWAGGWTGEFVSWGGRFCSFLAGQSHSSLLLTRRFSLASTHFYCVGWPDRFQKLAVNVIYYDHSLLRAQTHFYVSQVSTL